MAIAGAISGIVSGVTGFMQAQYQAAVADMNSKVAKENAERAVERSRIEGEDNDMQTRALLAEQEVAQAASGVSLAGKSQVQTRASARKLGWRDTANIIHAGRVEEYNYLVQKANFDAEKKAAKISGVSSLIGGFLSAAGNMPTSMIGGSSSVAAPERIVPKPIPKPLITSYLKPPQNPLTVKKPSWAFNRGMI